MLRGLKAREDRFESETVGRLGIAWVATVFSCAHLIGQGEEADHLDVTHGWLQVLVEGGDGLIGDVVVTGDAAQVRDLKVA